MTQAHIELHRETFSRTLLGFWVYVMTDCILFATLFTTYAVLHTSTFGGPSPKDLFDLKTAFAETMVLLFSSVTFGFGTLSALKNKATHTILWYGIAFLLGASFVTMEILEFTGFINAGHSWKESAFLSSFFTLVGTHGLHVSFGLLWMLVVIFQLVFKGVTHETFRRMICLSIFWHFLDLVWIFIFTFVYLMGVSL